MGGWIGWEKRVGKQEGADRNKKVGKGGEVFWGSDEGKTDDLDR